MSMIGVCSELWLNLRAYVDQIYDHLKKWPCSRNEDYPGARNLL